MTPEQVMSDLVEAARRLEALGQDVVIGLLLYWGFKRKQAYEIEWHLGVLAKDGAA